MSFFDADTFLKNRHAQRIKHHFGLEHRRRVPVGFDGSAPAVRTCLELVFLLRIPQEAATITFRGCH